MDSKGIFPTATYLNSRPFPRGKLGQLDEVSAARVAAAGGDVALVIDSDGFIRDMALSSEDMVRDGAAAWLDQRWSDTVTADSRHKIDELLHDALRGGRTHWRQINQITASRSSIMMNYVAVDAGREGRVIAIGRDERATSAVQLRLLEAQQALERDYMRLRDAEFRYRLLFDISGEAVIIVDVNTKRVVEANPAAEKLVGLANNKLVGEQFTKIFDGDSQDEAASLLAVIQSTQRASAFQRRLSSRGRELLVSGSLFRNDRNTLCLMRLTPSEGANPEIAELSVDLETLMEQVPDAFVITDSSLKILAVNTVFLDMVRIPTKEQARGQALDDFLGSSGLGRNLLVETLREHGSIKNFATVLRSQYNENEDVAASAVFAPNILADAGGGGCFGFTIRTANGRLERRSQNPSEARRSVEQLTQLVGRVKLKELVRESTDLVERLCIEAALELTKDNRASAAEMLGLSRQSLYSKLHRFGLGNMSGG
jgi:transcriptional regulator PpsR